MGFFSFNVKLGRELSLTALASFDTDGRCHLQALLHSYFFSAPLPAHHSELPIAQRAGRPPRLRPQGLPADFSLDLPLERSLVDATLLHTHAGYLWAANQWLKLLWDLCLLADDELLNPPDGFGKREYFQKQEFQNLFDGAFLAVEEKTSASPEHQHLCL